MTTQELMQHLTDNFAELKVTEQELPDKTKRKLAKMRDILNPKLIVYRDKATGVLTEKSKTQLKDLVDDIVVEAEAYAESKAPQKTPEEIAAEKAAADKAAEQTSTKGKTKTTKKSKGGFWSFGWLFGEDE